MITLKKLYLKNFMSIKETSIELKHGVICFNGENGAGKSAPVDAIAVCLADGKKRSDSMLDYIRKGEKHAYIQLWADYLGEEIFFDISLNQEKANTFQRKIVYKGTEYLMAEASALLQELNITYYSKIILLMQDSDCITKLTPTQRAEYLQKLLSFDFSEQIEFIDKELLDLNEQQTQLSSELKAIESNISMKESEVMTPIVLPWKDEDLSSFHSEIASLEQEIIKAQSSAELVALNEQKSTKEKEYFGLKNRYTEIANIQGNIQMQKANLEGLVRQRTNADTEIANLEEIINAHKLRELPSEIPSEQITSLETKIQEQNFSLRELTSQVNLIKQGNCPTCKRPFEVGSCADMEASIANLTIKVKEDTDTLNGYRQTNDSCRKVIVNYEMELRANETKLASLKSSRDNLQAMVEGASNIEEIDYTSELENITIRGKELKGIIDTIDYQIEAIKQKETNIVELTNKKKDFESKILMQERAIERQKFVEENNIRINKFIEDSRATFDLKSEGITKLNSGVMLRDSSKKLISKDLTNYLIVKMCNTLETSMNEFIQSIFPNMAVSLFQSKKGVEFFYTLNKEADKGKSKESLINVKMASGFQKEVLSIAFKITLCRAYNLDMMILDECDKTASDNSSAKLFEGILRDEAIKQLFVITHKPMIKDMIKAMAEDISIYKVADGYIKLSDD